MDTESQELFDRLAAKAPHELLPSDIEFLRSRESYLSDADKAKFAEVLHSEGQEVADDTADETSAEDSDEEKEPESNDTAASTESGEQPDPGDGEKADA